MNFFICNIVAEIMRSALAINKNASVNYDVTSRFDVVHKILLKS